MGGDRWMFITCRWRTQKFILYISGSIHFAPLAGRILLKDVRYHSSNQTIKIVKAQILWRYWIRRPTTGEDLGLRVGGDDGTCHT